MQLLFRVVIKQCGCRGPTFILRRRLESLLRARFLGCPGGALALIVADLGHPGLLADGVGDGVDQGSPIVLLLHRAQLLQLLQKVRFQVALTHDVVIVWLVLYLDFAALKEAISFLVWVGGRIVLPRRLPGTAALLLELGRFRQLAEVADRESSADLGRLGAIDEDERLRWVELRAIH